MIYLQKYCIYPTIIWNVISYKNLFQSYVFDFYKKYYAIRVNVPRPCEAKIRELKMLMAGALVFSLCASPFYFLYLTPRHHGSKFCFLNFVPRPHQLACFRFASRHFEFNHIWLCFYSDAIIYFKTIFFYFCVKQKSSLFY
jgi:hypothetical protein